MKNRGLWVIVGVLALVLALSAVGYRFLAGRFAPAAPPEVVEEVVPLAETDAGEEDEAVMAPDFTVLDVEGAAVRLSDFVGRPVIVNFWATWCPPCRGELPDFDAAWAEYGEDVVFMMVDLTDGSRDTVESAKAFVEENGYGFPVYFDTDASAAMAYGVNAIPTTVLVGPDGSILGGQIGAVSEEGLARAMELLTSTDRG